MGIAKYIKEIGRGKEGARSLSRPDADDLMSQVLNGAVSDLEIGAFALAMRIKGESVAELAGFVDAVHARCPAIETRRPTVLLPSYNGARKLPNLTALLALLLAREGVQVLMHGPLADPTRVTTAEIVRDLGLPPADDAAGVAHAWARGEPAFIATDRLCPPLARLLDVRRVVGLRNSGHTAAKLLAPCSGATLRIVNHTHPDYAGLIADYLALAGAHGVLMRGTEGEPVADPRRSPKLDVYIAGVLRPDLSLSAHDGVLTELPVLPPGRDAATTARYIEAVMQGEKPAPAPISRQVRCLAAALTAIETLPAAEKSA